MRIHSHIGLKYSADFKSGICMHPSVVRLEDGNTDVKMVTQVLRVSNFDFY